MLNPRDTHVDVHSSMVLALLSYTCVESDRDDPESDQQPAYVRLPAYVLSLSEDAVALRAGSGNGSSPSCCLG
jgi:hypothetical protein